MKSSSYASAHSNLDSSPSGDAIILFDFDGQPKLGTQSIRPGGTFVFTTSEFPVQEPLTITGPSPFADSEFFTNTPLKIRTDIHPKESPFKFGVEFQGVFQEVFVRVLNNGVEAGELTWHDNNGSQQWRVALRMSGPQQTVQLVKELAPTSPFYNYQFVVYNQITRQDVPVTTTPGGQEVVVSEGDFTTVAVPPGVADTGAGPDEVGGTDAADLIISPGG